MGRSKVPIILRMVRFSHTAFALPFAFMGAFLAAKGIPTWYQLFWILMAMVGARTGALSLNRYADAELDAQNPRTMNWPIPRGLVSKGEALILMVTAWALFLLAAYMLRPWLVFLTPIPLSVFIIYPYTKRFTWACHFLNGLGLGLAAPGAWLAIRGDLGLPPIIIMLAVITWVAGFDILYSLEDLQFDIEKGLKSIPQRFGVRASFILARILHASMIALLLSLYFIANLGPIYLLGLLAATGLIFYEHIFLRGEDPSRVEGAFFTVNGFVSILLFSFTLADVIRRTAL